MCVIFFIFRLWHPALVLGNSESVSFPQSQSATGRRKVANRHY